ncbi:MAG: hypothetical protein NVS2B12_31260 [Ktedonobacteraceae bacterium]
MLKKYHTKKSFGLKGKINSMPILPSISISQASRQPFIPETPSPGKHPCWRSLVLCLLLLLTVVVYVLLIEVAPKQRLGPVTLFTQVWVISLLPYFGASAFVLLTKPFGGRWRWIELGIIFVGAFVFRAMLLPLPPILSNDSWRYLWDARVFLHGYSPYVTVPNDPILLPLRDLQIYWQMAYRDVPTIYPPGALYIYALSYLLAPSNLYFLKAIFLVCDMATCAVLAILLARKGLDARRVILYAWSPLPIVEFAVQGHVDVVSITFTVLAVLCATSTRPGSRALTGFLIAIATLIKIYPILMLVVVIRCRDWQLLAICIVTIVLAYTPLLILGHGQAFGYFSTYADQQGASAGVVQLVTFQLGQNLGFNLAKILLLQHIVDVLVIALISLIVWALRLFKQISIEAATLILFGTIFAISSHILPWYTPALLVWIVLLRGRLWTKQGPSASGLAVAATWYFTWASLFGYFIPVRQSWFPYYLFVYGVVIVGLAIALTLGVRGELKQLYRMTLEGRPR